MKKKFKQFCETFFEICKKIKIFQIKKKKIYFFVILEIKN